MNKLTKITYFEISGFHLTWLLLGIMFGEGILFGIRVFEEIQMFHVGQTILVGVSGILIYKNQEKRGNVLLAISVLSTYIIEFGHRMYWLPLGLFLSMYPQQGHHRPSHFM